MNERITIFTHSLGVGIQELSVTIRNDYYIKVTDNYNITFVASEYNQLS